MSLQLRDNATRSTARTAAVAACLVLAVQVVQAVLGILFSVLGGIIYFGSGDVPVSALNMSMIGLAMSGLPFAVGVFLAFWCVVPLTGSSSLPQTLLRSFVAEVIATIVSFVVTSISALGGVFTSDGRPLFGNSFPFGDAADVGFAVYGTLQTTLYSFVSLTPLVMLAGLLAWFWTARPSPAASAD
jgi:hypothetical protein